MNRAPTLLVVDDEISNIILLSSLLGKHYNLRTANSGAAALDSVKEVRPDLILLDIIMPEMGGFEVCRRLKDNLRTENIPIIFISALEDEDDVKEGLNLGAIDFVHKPFNPGILKIRLRNYLALFDYRMREMTSCRVLIKSAGDDTD